uniref:Uncharacterized protein n=1 Tax=Anguilla anguilla TaxID=7936 RepID=A0A0E9PAT2_ANGAN
MYRTSSERTPREFNVLSPIKPFDRANSETLNEERAQFSLQGPTNEK